MEWSTTLSSSADFAELTPLVLSDTDLSDIPLIFDDFNLDLFESFDESIYEQTSPQSPQEIDSDSGNFSSLL